MENSRKRKGSDSGTPAKRVKRSVPDEANNVIPFLLDLTKERFLSEFWEKKPLHVSRKLSTGWFSVDALRAVADTRPLLFGQHINACRYQDGVKEMRNGEGPVSSSDINCLLESGTTLQVHHPQHFSEDLWRMLSVMEELFGCLCGSNSYITPPGQQGLAPHYDDVDVFIVQLEGKKKWRLYALPPDQALPRSYSDDIPEEALGDPLMELTLVPGDVLYFPRGTIHCAVSCGDVTSHHVTISTYQRNTVGDFAAATFPILLDNSMDEDVALRQGLPLNFLSFLGSHTIGDVPTGEQLQFVAQMKAALHAVVDRLELPQLCMAADLVGTDFIHSRLPPHTDRIPDIPQSTSTAGKIKIVNPSWLRVTFGPGFDIGSDGEEGEGEHGEGESDAGGDAAEDVYIHHCLGNQVDAHMGGEGQPSYVRIPASAFHALQTLLSSSEWVSIDELPASPEDTLALVSALQSTGLAEVSN